MGGVCISGAVESRRCLRLVESGEAGRDEDEDPYPAIFQVEEGWVVIRVIERKDAYTTMETKRQELALSLLVFCCCSTRTVQREKKSMLRDSGISIIRDDVSHAYIHTVAFGNKVICCSSSYSSRDPLHICMT